MRPLRMGLGALSVALLGVVLTPAGGSAAQEILQARISPQQVTPTGAPLVESIDVCNRGASLPQINVVVTGPDGEVVIDQWHLVGTEEPGVVVGSGGDWSVELVLRDAAGQPTGEPYPSLGTYTVHVDCVTTYTPRVRIPYNDLTFEVVESTTPTSPPDTTPTTAAPPGTGDRPSPPEAIAAVPVRQEPDYTG